MKRTFAGFAVAALAVGTVAAATVVPVTPAGAAPTELLFSEYVEGSGFNKAVEIYNGTGAPVDLAAGGYRLELYSNGSATVSQSVARFAMRNTGTLGSTICPSDAVRSSTVPAMGDRSAKRDGSDAVPAALDAETPNDASVAAADRSAACALASSASASCTSRTGTIFSATRSRLRASVLSASATRASADV